MKLETLQPDLTVCKVPDFKDINTDGDFFFIAKTDRETSLVCPTEYAPLNCTERNDGWKGFRIKGSLDFSLIGVLSDISGVLTENGISIFAVSTYDTDYILVKKECFGRALDVLEKKGFETING